MTIAHLLEDFGRLTEIQETSSADGTPGEAELLDSFEQGYKAGWDDAIVAKSEERSNVSADFARNLSDLGFTYFEARDAMVAEIAPVVEEAVKIVLPEVSRQSMGDLVVEQLREIIEENADTPVIIMTSSDDYQALSDIMPDDVNFPIDIVRDAKMSSGQVRFQFGQRERQLDLDALVKGVQKAFSGFSHETLREAKNG